MKTYILKIILLVFIGLCIVKPSYLQAQSSDSIFHPYHVNYWVTGGIIVAGTALNYLGSSSSQNKPAITASEIQNLNNNLVNSFDRSALKQDPLKKAYYANLSDNLLSVFVVLPGFMLFDNKIRHDWFDVLLMYLETISISNNIYENSPMGPNYQSRFRPAVYYNNIPIDQKSSGWFRSSFYSGHTASVAAASFFIVKVYTDYHPEIGDYKYLLYAAATIPPLIEGYVRMRALFHFPSDVLVGLGVGALCGIVIPEFHRLQDKNIKLGLFTTPEATGITLNWQPDFLK